MAGSAVVGGEVDDTDGTRARLLQCPIFDEVGQRLTDDESLLEAVLLDESGLIELIVYLEATFEIAIGDDEVVPKNFDSIAKLTRYVQRKVAERGEARPR